jgi:hypothetical protein
LNFPRVAGELARRYLAKRSAYNLADYTGSFEIDHLSNIWVFIAIAVRFRFHGRNR